MKHSELNLTNKILLLVFCCIMMTFTFVGCEHDIYNPNRKGNDSNPNPFNFSTTSSIQLNVKYDVPEGYKVLFEVYLENPFTADEDGQIIKRTDLEPIIRRMTDENGAYNGKETVDSDHGNEVYIYTSYIGVPTIFQTDFTGETITANIGWATENAPQTRAIGMTEAPKGYHVLGGWNVNGYPDYLDKEGTISIPAKVLKTINKTLPEKGICPKQYRQSVDFEINDPKGRNAEVSVRMIGGSSSAASVFGYYCYKSDASKEEIEKAPRCIIFPNTLMTRTDGKQASGLRPGECVKLHYINPEGIDEGTEFPNGIKIGWFLLNNRFYNGKGPFFSTTELNSDGRTHTAAFRIDDFVVLSFEDWTEDQDYNDIQFNVWSNPIEAIIKPDLPNVKPDGDDDEGEKYSKDYKGIIAFEDNWPYKGDYDLNDVIVKYSSRLNFNNKNEVLSTEDTYELLWSGATFKNGFAYQLNADRTNVKTELLETPSTFAGQGLDTEISKATINVLLSAVDVTANNKKVVTYKIKNHFITPISHEILDVPPYNPFIMVHDGLGQSRIEVHLVNYPPTEKADPKRFHTGQDLSNVPTSYYVGSGNYPFAIHLSNAEAFNTPEAKAIDTSFEHFIDWVNSNGAEYKNWYK